MTQWDTIQKLLQQAVTDRVTPGLQCSVRWRSTQGTWDSVDLVAGTLDYSPDSPSVTQDTCYDLASVTKALVALSWVRFAAQEKLSLESLTAEQCWPLAKNTHAGGATLDQLLSHRSELAAWCPMFAETTPDQAGSERARNAVFSRLFAEPLEPNGHTVRYSDLGYITVGEALAGAMQRPLAQCVHEQVIVPLGLERQLAYHPVSEERWSTASNTAPTEECSWRKRTMRGHVHDENAFALGGVCGHAGLFGTARALADLGQHSLQVLLDESNITWMSRASMQAMIALRDGGSHRLGWDGKSASGSSAGDRASPATFGHLGFTGTMLWCDPDAQLCVSIVSNRVHPTRENQGIRKVRPVVMDAIFTLLRGA